MKTRIIPSIITIVFALIASCPVLHAEESKEPQDLTILRDAYQKAIERATSPVQGKYVEELRKLKLRYTKDGNLEGALVVDKELSVMLSTTPKSIVDNKKPTTPKGPDHLIGEWYCNDAEADIYLIKSNKKAFHAADIGTWASDDQTLTITWANGFRLVIDLNQTDDTVFGKSYRPGATQYDLLKFTRKKDK